MDTSIRTPLPLWFLENNANMYFDLSGIVMRYRIDHIIYGYPSGNTNIIKKITHFVTQLKTCLPDTVMFHPIDEHFSSVQASARTGDFDHKHVGQDSIVAMIMLEQYSRENT